jgi:hypothetical protein
MREDLPWRLAFCFLKVPRSGLFFAESKLVLAGSLLVLAGPALGGAGAKKSAQKRKKPLVLARTRLKAPRERDGRIVQGRFGAESVVEMCELS